jgi:hypothetical protein
VPVKALETKPELEEHLVFYWETFFELSATRNVTGMGDFLPISLSELLAHCALYGYTRADAQRIWGKVQVLDREYLRLVAEKNKTSSKKSSQSKGPQR